MQTRPFAPGRVYLDIGTAEAMGPRRLSLPRWPGKPPAERFVDDARALRDLLRTKGLRDGHS
ncbi:MAG: hypothetical protein ACUVSX_13085, partial [Aggregatilineales bacterium]